MQWTSSITSTGTRAEFFDGVLPIDSTARWSLQRHEFGSESDPSNARLWAIISAMLNMSLDARQSSLTLDLEDHGIQAIVSSAHEVVRYAVNRAVARRAASLLNELEQALRRTVSSGLPVIHAFEMEDDSILLEWVLPNRRAGITVDANAAQSGWYLLTKDATGEQQTWGYLDTLSIDALIHHMQRDLVTT